MRERNGVYMPSMNQVNVEILTGRSACDSFMCKEIYLQQNIKTLFGQITSPLHSVVTGGPNVSCYSRDKQGHVDDDLISGL